MKPSSLSHASEFCWAAQLLPSDHETLVHANMQVALMTDGAQRRHAIIAFDSPTILVVFRYIDFSV